MENYIRRDGYLEQLINRRENGLIKVITGIRRCGKSFLLFNLFYDYLLGEGVPEDHIITIALDDDLNIAYRDPAELSRYIRSKVTDQEGMFYIFIDEIYLLFQHEYSANFLFTLWKRVRKYGACCTGLTQNVDDLLQSHTARTMLANSEFLVMLNQAATDRAELARLLNISDNQLSYITNVDFGRGLIKCGSAIVPFMDNFPKNRLYRLMTTKLSETNVA